MKAEMEINYVYKMEEAGPEHFGPCEVCGMRVDKPFVLIQGRTYDRGDGSTGISHYKCFQKTGHKDCLSGLTKWGMQNEN